MIKSLLNKLMPPKVFTDDEKYASLSSLLLNSWNKFYIETGCENGDSMELAKNAQFVRLYGIELDVQSVQKCRDRFRDHSNITILHGPSAEGLHRVLFEVDAPATILLDAHPATVDEEWPILEELYAIACHGIKNHTILIDDMRHFGKGKVAGKEAVIRALKRINLAYSVSYWNGRMKDDILVARVG